MDDLEFLDGAEAPVGEVQAEPTPETVEAQPEAEQETAEQKESRERDERGRFKARDAEQPMVPLAALHETRDKVRDLEARLAAMNPPPVQQQVPDMFEDPEGYQAHLANQVQQTVFNQTLNISEEMTRQQVGAELVDQATEWARQVFAVNPAAHQIFASQRNPYGWLVSEYQRQSAMSRIGSDPKQIEAFLAWQQAQQAPTPQARIPDTLADAQSSRAAAVPHTPPSLDDILSGKT